MNIPFLLTSLMVGLFAGALVNIALGEKAYNLGGLLGGLLVGGLIALLG
jgi:hypothetical protein